MGENGWDSLFAQESEKPYSAGLQAFVAGKRTGQDPLAVR